ncbi:MAG: hypothetical protein L6R37_008147 [Teloschistes peruensis]|nr:MAG: hypothetical protein L6R37_008147 [Teloschistes peruensis]
MKYIVICATLLLNIVSARPTANETRTLSPWVLTLPPPGPQPYIYQVRYSDLTLSCRYQKPRQPQDITAIDRLLKRIMSTYGDPNKRATHAFHHAHQKYQWVEGDWVHAGEVAILRAPAYHPTLQPRAPMTWDNIVNTVLGYNNLRHQYPGLIWGLDVFEERDGMEKNYLGFFCVRGFNSKELDVEMRVCVWRCTDESTEDETDICD